MLARVCVCVCVCLCVFHVLSEEVEAERNDARFIGTVDLGFWEKLAGAKDLSQAAPGCLFVTTYWQASSPLLKKSVPFVLGN